MEEKLLTIIIPAFNVSKYILTALDSIKNQTLKSNSYEVLIINDGSTDDSATKSNQWINENKLSDNFKIINKNNGNWGSVINYAKNNKLINGKYVAILDADDLLNNNCFENVFEILKSNNYDIVISNFYRKNNNKIKKTKVIYSNKSRLIKKERTFSAWNIPMCKFFKSSLFYKQQDLREGVSYQDQILFHYFINDSQSIYFINKCLGTYYENREGSSTIQPWNEFRIKLWCDNMNKILEINNQYVAAYVSMFLRHCYNKAPKNLKHLVKIDSKFIPLIKKSSFKWLSFSTRWLAKIIYHFLLLKIIRNSK